MGDAVPLPLLLEAVVPRTRDQATAVNSRYQGEDRQGPANNHGNDPTSMLDQALLGPDAEPPAVSDTTVVPPSGPHGEASSCMCLVLHVVGECVASVACRCRYRWQ